MDKLDSDVVVHVCVVVRNVEEAARNFAKLFGRPVPGVIETAGNAESRAEYRGSPTEGRAKLAFVPVGPNLTLEIAEPVDGPSTWSEFLEKHGPGIHHLGIVVKGLEENVKVLTAAGADLVQTGVYPGGGYAYVDATRQIGAIVELLANA